MKSILGLLAVAAAYFGFSKSAAADVAPSTGAGPLDPLALVPIVQSAIAAVGAPFRVSDILAIIEIESSFRPAAIRAEDHIGDASRGLMQILLSSARDRGFGGDPGELFDPSTNIHLGVSHLEWGRRYLVNRLGAVTMDQVVGAYNAGVGNVVKGYIPMTYVRKFVEARDRWREKGYA